MAKYHIEYAVEEFYDPYTGEAKFYSDDCYYDTKEEADEKIQHLINIYGENLRRLTLTTIERII